MALILNLLILSNVYLFTGHSSSDMTTSTDPSSSEQSCDTVIYLGPRYNNPISLSLYLNYTVQLLFLYVFKLYMYIHLTNFFFHFIYA